MLRNRKEGGEGDVEYIGGSERGGDLEK